MPCPQHCSAALLKVVGKHSPYMRFPSMTWLLWPEGLVFLAPMELTIGKPILVKISYPRWCTDSNRNISSLSLKKAHLSLKKASTWEMGFSFATYLEATEVLWGNIGRETPLLYLPLSLPQFTAQVLQQAYMLPQSSRKEHIHSTEALILATVIQVMPPDLMIWSTKGLWLLFHRTLYICIFKKKFCLFDRERKQAGGAVGRGRGRGRSRLLAEQRAQCRAQT